MTYHELLNILLSNKKNLIKITIGSTVLFFLILFFVYPITYSSTVKILPPDVNKGSSFGSIINNPDILNLINLNSSTGNSQLFAEIIKSRSAAEFVIRKCRLMEYFDTKDTQLAAAKLSRLLDVEVNKEGILSVSVDLSTPLFGRFSEKNNKTRILSASVSNAYCDALDKINQDKLNSRAKRSREFVEKQLLSTKANLDSSEVALKKFQEKNKTISLPEQLEAAIQTAAKIKSEIIFTEIQIGTLGSNLIDKSKDLEGLNKKLSELKKQYSQIEAGEKLNSDYIPNFNNIPALSLDLARLLRDVKIQNEVYLLLQKQFFSEKIQENKDVPTVEILDQAIPPFNAKSPRLFFHTILGGMIIFVLTCGFIIYKENKNKILQNKRS